MATIKARHKSHCDHTSSCDERLRVHGSAAHTCWQAACSRRPRASSSAPAWERENGQFLVHLFPPAAPTRWSPAVIPQHIQECRRVTWNCQPAMPQSPHTCRLHQRRRTNYTQHPSHVFQPSFQHTATRKTEVFVTPCASPHNQIVHAPRTAAAHTHQTSVPRTSVVRVLQWAAPAEASYCRKYCSRSLTPTRPPPRWLRNQCWARQHRRGSPQGTASTRPSSTVSNAVEMP
ncbi:hypothetical protein TcCL_NonESM12934, partial [Trypanosoma cruzi]